MIDIFFSLVFLVNLTLTGCYFSNKFNLSKNIFSSLSIGFVFQIAILEILGWWMVAFKMPMKLFMALVFLLCSVCCILGIKVLKQTKESLFIKMRDITSIVLLIIIIVMCVFLFVFYRSDADDSFYVSNVMLFSQSDIINPYDSSFGNESLGTMPMYDYQVWESYLAVFCKVFTIKPTIMCHFIMVFILLIIAVSAYSYLGEILFSGDTKKKNVFCIALLLFYMMGGYAVYSKGSFLLSRIWQGKAVYLHIVLPFVIAIMLQFIDDKKEQKNKWALLMVAMFAGIGLNPTSMYVIGFQILFMMIAVSIFNKNYKDVLCVIPSILVVGFYSVLLYISASKNTGQIEAASSVGEGFVLDVFKTFFGTGMSYFIVFVVCAGMVLKFGKAKGKLLCVYTPFLMLIGIWNPIMGPIIAENLTMTPSFWRVFWLIPIDFAIAYCIVLFFEGKKSVFISIALTCAVLVCGKFMFTKSNNFVRAKNFERIPEETIVFGDIISSNEKPQIVLANDMASTTIRQEYNDIELMVSRPGYILDLFRYRGDSVGNDDRFILYYFVNNDSAFDGTQISTLLQKYNVGWVIIDDSKVQQEEFLLTHGYELREECEGDLLFQKQ